jgi:hypothetical protein
MGYTIQEKDFVKRTKEIIQQYDNVVVPDKERYEVTLLLNCMVGLLILPQQKWLNNLPSDVITEKKWGIDSNKIDILSQQNKTVKEVARHMRNAISHFRFFALNENREINSIWFIDHDLKTKKDTFEVTLSVANLRTFVEKLSSWHLSQV